MLGAKKQIVVARSQGLQERALLDYHLARGMKPEFKWIKDSMLDFDKEVIERKETRWGEGRSGSPNRQGGIVE